MITKEEIAAELRVEAKRIMSSGKYAKVPVDEMFREVRSKLNYMIRVKEFGDDLLKKLNELLDKNNIDHSEEEREEFLDFIRPVVLDLTKEYLHN